MINVYVFATKQFLTLIQDVLLPTFFKHHPDHGINIFAKGRGVPPNLGGSTHTPVFKDLMLERVLFYLQTLKKHKNEKVLFLDCDIIIFQPFIDNLEKLLKEKDILHQGGGVLAFNSNERTIDLFQGFIDRCLKIPIDKRPPAFPEFELQDSFKELGSSSWIAKLPEEYGYLCEDSYIYHAMNGGNTILEKKAILAGSFMAYDILQKNKVNELFKDSERYQSFKKNKENIIFSHGFLCIRDTSDGKIQNFKIEPTVPKLINEEFFDTQEGEFFVAYGTSWNRQDHYLCNIKTKKVYFMGDKNNMKNTLFF